MSMAQLNFIKNDQIDQIAPWFPWRFPNTDSIGIVEQNGINGGTYELLLVYPDTMFQITNVTYDQTTEAATANKSKLRDAEYLRKQIESERDQIAIRSQRDSLFLARYMNVYDYLSTLIDTTQSNPPADTTGN